MTIRCEDSAAYARRANANVVVLHLINLFGGITVDLTARGCTKNSGGAPTHKIRDARFDLGQTAVGCCRLVWTKALGIHPLLLLR